MKFFGYSETSTAPGKVVPETLAEVTLVATPQELRRIAEFLVSTAADMDAMQATYSHEHLSDWDHSFKSAPHFVVARPESR
jgi:hypothetical protein